MHFVEKEPSQKRIDFDTKLKSNKILRVPGAYNPLTAKLIEEIGYDAVYVSGGVMANDLGFPDIGLIFHFLRIIKFILLFRNFIFISCH